MKFCKTFRNTNQWPQSVSKQDRAYYTSMIDNMFQDKNKDRPNLWIHADLFGPILTAVSNKKFFLCITDAFNAVVIPGHCQQGG